MVFNSLILSSLKLETIPMSINSRTDQIIAAYSLSEIVHSYEKELLLNAKTWINLIDVMLSEGSQTQKSYTEWFHLYEAQNHYSDH